MYPFSLSTTRSKRLRKFRVTHNTRENAQILSKQVIGDIFSQSRYCCWSVCVVPVLYIAPEEIVQRMEIKAVQRPAPAHFFFSGKRCEMTRFLKWISTKSKVRAAVCALIPSCWNPNFKNFFIAVNWEKASSKLWIDFKSSVIWKSSDLVVLWKIFFGVLLFGWCPKMGCKWKKWN